jgi:hypothetical protein
MGSDKTEKDVVSSLLDRTSLHTGPFCVFNFNKVGRGFLFLQSQQDLKDFRYLSSCDQTGTVGIVCMYVCMYVCMFVCIYVCVYMCICVYEGIMYFCFSYIV